MQDSDPVALPTPNSNVHARLGFKVIYLQKNNPKDCSGWDSDTIWGSENTRHTVACKQFSLLYAGFCSSSFPMNARNRLSIRWAPRATGGFHEPLKWWSLGCNLHYLLILLFYRCGYDNDSLRSNLSLAADARFSIKDRKNPYVVAQAKLNTTQVVPFQ
jgi:hypothetical protein